MAVKEGQIYKITHDFEDWTLDDTNDGRKEFFKLIMEALGNTESGFATFNMREPMPRGAGGFFTNRLSLNKIAIPNIVEINEKDKKIKFVDEIPDELNDDEEKNGNKEIHEKSLTSEEAWAIFVHEACHFLHFSRDKGVYDHPLMKGCSNTMDEITQSMKYRRACEYEAGFRSIRFAMIYDMFKDNRRLFLDVNVRNMLHYDIKNQSKEWKEKFDADTRPFFDDLQGLNLKTGQMETIKDKDGKPYAGKLIDEKGYFAYMENLYSKVEKFKDWADPKHEILGVLN